VTTTPSPKPHLEATRVPTLDGYRYEIADPGPEGRFLISFEQAANREIPGARVSARLNPSRQQFGLEPPYTLRLEVESPEPYAHQRRVFRVDHELGPFERERVPLEVIVRDMVAELTRSQPDARYYAALMLAAVARESAAEEANQHRREANQLRHRVNTLREAIGNVAAQLRTKAGVRSLKQAAKRAVR
jgi:hypothetical protein